MRCQTGVTEVAPIVQRWPHCTADALHRNANIARLIVGRGADYLIALKGNRPSLLAEVQRLFASPQSAIPEHVTIDNNHGRLETRRHRVWHDVGWLTPIRSEANEAPLAGVAKVGTIESTTERAGRTSTERRYDVSCRVLDAEQFAAAARAHWAIENSLHWGLDVAFDEDRART